MIEYIASNGTPIVLDDQGGIQFTHGFQMGALTGVFASQAEALREFFQSERDAELWRWRWDGNPDYVVYPRTSDPARKARGVTVLSELIPRPYTVWEDNVDTLYGTSVDEESRQLAREAARAYFDAHPESEPWHAAEPGEAWALKTSDYAEETLYTYKVSFSGAHYFERHDSNSYELHDSRVKSGRRIWPEVSE